jgi:hypothetical protein
MDPFTLAMMGGQSALGLTQGAIMSTANNASQRLNRQKLEELNKLQASGGLGLTGVQQRAMAQGMVAPVQRQATEARQRSEQFQAAQGATGGQLAAGQMQQAELVGDAVAQAAQQVAMANEQKKQAQLQEIEARTAAKAGMRADDLSAVMGGVSDVSAALGTAAGAPPGTFQLGPMFGGQYKDLLFDESELDLIEELAKKDPAAIARIRAQLEGGLV